MSLDERLLQEATSIGDELAHEAFWYRGRCNWLAARFDASPAGVPLARVLDPSVSLGTAGLALFFARLHSETADPRHRRLAEGAARNAIHRAWHVGSSPTSGQIGAAWRFSLFLGTLGIAWAAHEVHRRIGEPDLAWESRRLVRELAESRTAPHEVDLMFGSASGIPALHALSEAGIEEANDLAVHLARGVVKRAERRAATASWSGAARGSHPLARNLTGMSHGAAGIGLGLARAYSATGLEACREASLQAFAYERALHEADAEGWPDYLAQPTPDGRFPPRATWCHGAPGIGFARALAHPLLKDDDLLEDARLALGPARRALADALARPGHNFAPCCGVSGIAESVGAIEDALGSRDGAQVVRHAAAYGIERFGRDARASFPGAVEWPTGVAHGALPGLLHGRAGIGCFLLRARDPAGHASVLAGGA